MPRISSFYGIDIYMYWREHGPPHFHAIYAEHEATIEIGTWQVIAGRLPSRALRLVREWARGHEAELRHNWNRARLRKAPVKIDPLP